MNSPSHQINLPDLLFRSVEISRRAVCMADNRGVLVYCNRAFVELFGLDSSQVIVGRACDAVFAQLMDGWDPAQSEQTSGVPIRLQNPTRESAQGNVARLQIEVTPLRGHQGEALGAIYEIEDPGEVPPGSPANQVKGAGRVFGSHERGMGRWEWDLSSGQLRVDHWIHTLCGQPPCEASIHIDKAFEIVHPEDLPQLRALIERAIEDGTDCHVEFRLKPDGDSERWIVVMGQVQRDTDGNRVAVTGVSFDITKYKVVESELTEQTERLNAIINTAIEAIITIDRNGLIQSVNRAGEEMFGYTSDELIGKNVSILMPPQYSEHHDGYIKRYQHTGEKRIIGKGRELLAKRRDGSTFPVELLVGEIDHMQKYTGLIRDISDRRQIEDQLSRKERINAMGTLAAGLGHDMSNILLPVRARLDAIASAQLPEEVQDQIREIRKSMSYLQDLAESLNLLILDPEDEHATEEQTDLRSWWIQTHSLLSKALPDHVVFTSAIAPDLPPVAIAPHRLTQAVLNMLINSGKAVREKDGHVCIWAKPHVDSNAIRVGVADNGIGMADSVKGRVFEPFFTTKTRGIGTGLGLTLVHSIIQSVSGTIEIDSKLGEGTEIVMTIPSVSRTDEHRREEQRHAKQAVGFVTVENPRTRSIVVHLLEMAGVRVETGPPTGWGADRVSVMVTDTPDPNTDAIESAISNGCSVIVLGDGYEVARNANVTILRDANDVDSLRAAIFAATEGKVG